MKELRNWFKSLNRQQAGILGAVLGYIIGSVSAPIIKLFLAIGIVILFGLMGRHLESKFESKLGFTGIIAAILVCTTMGPIQQWISSLIGGVIVGASRIALTLVGGYVVLQLHSSSTSSK